MLSQETAQTPFSISEEVLSRTKTALESHGINVIVVDTKEVAFQLMKDLIPSGAEVMTGSSTTLQQIGFMDYYISNQHPWKNLGTPIFKEQD